MKIIKEISCMIDDELDGAEEYIKAALQVREERPNVAALFFNHARDEMTHMEELHSAVVKLIKEYRDEHGDPPPGMMSMYEYLHEKHMRRASLIQMYIKEYSES